MQTKNFLGSRSISKCIEEFALPLVLATTRTTAFLLQLREIRAIRLPVWRPVLRVLKSVGVSGAYEIQWELKIERVARSSGYEHQYIH